VEINRLEIKKDILPSLKLATSSNPLEVKDEIQIEGEKSFRKGEKLIQEGIKKLSSAAKLFAGGKQLVTEGKEEVTQGELTAKKGIALQSEGEKRFLEAIRKEASLHNKEKEVIPLLGGGVEASSKLIKQRNREASHFVNLVKEEKGLLKKESLLLDEVREVTVKEKEERGLV